MSLPALLLPRELLLPWSSAQLAHPRMTAGEGSSEAERSLPRVRFIANFTGVLHGRQYPSDSVARSLIRRDEPRVDRILSEGKKRGSQLSLRERRAENFRETALPRVRTLDRSVDQSRRTPSIAPASQFPTL